MIRCCQSEQSAAGRGSLVGTQPGVVDYPARLCDFPLDDLQPRYQKALAIAVGNERIAHMASLYFAHDHAIRDQLVERFKIELPTADGRSHRAKRNAVGAAML